MPRKPIPLPAEFEPHPTDTSSVRCRICSETSLSDWIKKGSMSRHLKCEAHLSEVINQAERAAQAAADAARFAALQQAVPASLPDVIFDQPDQRPNMFAETRDQAGLDHDSSVHFERLFGGPPVTFPFAMPKPHDSEAKRRQLAEHYEILLQQAEHEGQFGVTEEDEGFGLADEMQNLDLDNNPADPDEIQKYFDGVALDSDYSPYPCKLLMLLDILDNLPRLRLSSSLLRLVFWILKECGVPHVPSYDAFRKMQKDLREKCGSEPTKHQSMLGNTFFTNSIKESVARDFSNPEIAKHLVFYPEETDGSVSETWQAERWKEFPPSQLTPMYAYGNRQFFIEEVCQLETGQFVIPHDWVIRNRELTARCSLVSIQPDGWEIENEKRVVPASRFRHIYSEIVADLHGPIPWKEGTHSPKMPNELRKLAPGRELYVVMVPLWCDDVSGNQSKQYNKHINIYMVNGNLPGQMNYQEFFTTFVSTSPNATGPEQFSALKEEVISTHSEPIMCYNAHTRRECGVILRVPALPADNPQQSEEASHAGGNANCKCRKCTVGGNHAITESDEGYHALHFPGILRTAEETRNCLQRQIDLAFYGVEKPISDMQTATGTKDKIAQYWIDILLQKSKDMKKQEPGKSSETIAEELKKWLDDQPGERMNPLLSIDGLDPTQDTPVEILHTILLGIMKYVWHSINLNWSDSDRALFAIRLQSLDLSGLTVPPVRAAYMVQYRNNLIGKHFKTVMQTLTFAVQGLVTKPEFTLIQAVGALGAALWVHEIEDMKTYLDDLEILVGNVLDAFGDIYPDKIILKLKLHVLAHIRQDIKRFGPAVRFSTEIFECFNAVFRLCSIYSNHQAPSRDIGFKFASLDRLKHILSGGYWLDSKSGDWVCAGSSVLRVLRDEPVIQRHLGWVPKTKPTIGQVRVAGLKKNPAFQWKDTLAAKHFSISNESEAAEMTTLKWRTCMSAAAQSGDICRKKSWVFFDFQGATCIGRVAEMIVPDGGSITRSRGLITLENFALSEHSHPDYHLPFLRRLVDRSDDAEVNQPCYSVVWSSSIRFIFSAQHDCLSGNCGTSATRQQMQERQPTTRTESLICHSEDTVFILNLHALHNAALLRNSIPEHLSRPRPLYNDRRNHHNTLAAGLRITQTEKRAKTQEKRKATMAAKKNRKRQREEAMEEVENDIADDDDEDGEQHLDKRPRH